MKKTLLCILIALTAAFAAFPANGGQSNGGFENRKIGITFGNDCWTGALAYNNDDLLSYSAGLVWEGESFKAGVNAMGFTGRLLNERFDLLQALFSYNFEPTEHLLLTPRVGFDLYGFMHFDFLQNSLHRLMKIKTVELPYSKTDISFIPVVGLSASYTLPGDLAFVYADLDADIGFAYSQEAGIGLDRNSLSAFAGYRFNQSPLGDDVLDKQQSQAGGLRAGYSVDKGKFKMEFSFNPVTGNGNTIITISPLAEPIRSPSSDYTLYYIRSSLFNSTLKSNEIVLGKWVIVSRYSTGAVDSTRTDDWIWGAGYKYSYKGLSARIIGMYVHGWQRVPSGTDYLHSFSNHAGLALEVSYGVRLFEDYTISALGGGAYITGKGFGWELGLGITFD